MGNRRTGSVLIAVALLLAVAAFGWWLWENSDSRQNERETRALTEAMSGGDYEPADANAAPSIALGAVAGVLFLGGMVLVSRPPGGPGASDRP